MSAPAPPATGSTARASGPVSCRRSPAIPTVLDDDPSSLINLVLNGSNPLVVKGMPDAYRMPQFRLQLTDQHIADVVDLHPQRLGQSGAGGHGRAGREAAQDDRSDQRSGHRPENALAEDVRENYFPSRQMPSASCAGRSEIENSTDSFGALWE